VRLDVLDDMQVSRGGVPVLVPDKELVGLRPISGLTFSSYFQL
jgi:hypothetical protein